MNVELLRLAGLGWFGVSDTVPPFTTRDALLIRFREYQDLSNGLHACLLHIYHTHRAVHCSSSFDARSQELTEYIFVKHDRSL